MNITTQETILEPADNQRLNSLCGPYNDNIKQLERRLGIEINHRGNLFSITGDDICVRATIDILQSLYKQTTIKDKIIDIEPEQIHLAIKETGALKKVSEHLPSYVDHQGGKLVMIKTKRGIIKPRTANQAQ